MSKTICALGLVLALAGEALGAEARFAWAPNTETNLAGYKVYCGAASREYAAPVDQQMGTLVAGTVLGRVSGLEEGKTYFCAATAYDADGFESDFSNEVSFVAGDRVYPATPAEVRVVILRRHPDGTVDLLGADGTVIAAGVTLP